MLKRIPVLIILISCCHLPVKASTQQQEALMKFYHSEQQTWREYIARFPDTENQNNFDVTFYYLDVEISVDSTYIRGNVICRFQTTEDDVNTIILNLHHSLAIDSITGNVSQYETTDDSIHINLDRTFQQGNMGEVQIYYQGIPELAGGFKGLRYESHAISEPIIATLSTPFLAHYWWPCKDGPGDKPDSVYIDITIPDTTINDIPVIAVSNGVLENVISSNGKKTFQWRERYPIVPYYVMVAISNYQHFQQIYNGNQGERFQIDYYVFDEHLSEARSGVAQLPEVMNLFSDLFGSYPFHTEKYGMTQLGYYGGIENQTNTIINRMSLSWFDVSVHELAHSWFGDMITCKTWHHGWLNEGFATYCEALWIEHCYGFEAYQQRMAYNRYFNGGTLYLQNDSDPFNIFISIIYRKGAYILHTLRSVLGDSLFFKCLKAYASDPDLRYNHATTEDFQRICERISGMDLNFFFDQWVYDEYYPKYQFGFSQNHSSYKTTVIIEQIQSSDGWRSVFKMPIQLKFQFENGGDSLVTVWNDQQAQFYQFHFTQQISDVVIDPDEWILKEVSKQVPVPTEIYLSQNYPNPFNSTTRINYGLPQTSRVALKIFDILGKEVKTIVNKIQIAGAKSVIWDGRDNFGNMLCSGMYMCRLRVGDVIEFRKMIFLK